jgi:hypothetical protein
VIGIRAGRNIGQIGAQKRPNEQILGASLISCRACGPVVALREFFSSADALAWLKRGGDVPVPPIRVDISCPPTDRFQLVNALAGVVHPTSTAAVMLAGTLRDDDCERAMVHARIAAFCGKPLAAAVVHRYLSAS